MTLVDQLWAARRRWWIIVLCVIAGGGLAGYYASRQPKEYSATATVYATALGNAEITTEQVGSYAVVASSVPVMSSVVTQLGLSVPPQQLSHEVKATVSAGTALLTITVTDHSGRRAAAVANAAATALASAVKRIDESSRIRTVQTASTPHSPKSSKQDIDGAAGIVVGLIVGCLLALTIRMPKVPPPRLSAGRPVLPRRRRGSAERLELGKASDSQAAAEPDPDVAGDSPVVEPEPEAAEDLPVAEVDPEAIEALEPDEVEPEALEAEPEALELDEAEPEALELDEAEPEARELDEAEPEALELGEAESEAREAEVAETEPTGPDSAPPSVSPVAEPQAEEPELEISDIPPVTEIEPEDADPATSLNPPVQKKHLRDAKPSADTSKGHSELDSVAEDADSVGDTSQDQAEVEALISDEEAGSQSSADRSSGAKTAEPARKRSPQKAPMWHR